MLQDKLKEKKGFTIIEVVIVLAIAALIITVVLLAVSSLQRSQRTKAMQDFSSRLLTQMENYASDQIAANQDGTMTTTTSFPDNSGTKSQLNAPKSVTAISSSTTVPIDNTTVIYRFGGVCGNAGAITDSAQPAGGGDYQTKFTVSYWNENTKSATCISNK